jgi:hypothetical protein
MASADGRERGDRADVQYALELYLPRFGGDVLDKTVACAGAVAEQMEREGTRVRFLRSLFLRGDEVCLLLFDGPSGDAVTELARRAAISFERVLEVEVAVAEAPLNKEKP